MHVSVTNGSPVGAKTVTRRYNGPVRSNTATWSFGARPICRHAGPGGPVTEAPFLSTLAHETEDRHDDDHGQRV